MGRDCSGVLCTGQRDTSRTRTETRHWRRRETLDWRDAPGWLPAGVCPTRPCMLSFTSGRDAECRMHAVGWAIESESESENARPGVIEREGGNSAGCV